MATAKPKRTRITRQLLTDALVYNCPRYYHNGFASCCENMDGTYSNCVKDHCSQVSDIFRTMQKIADGEVEVW